MSEATWNAAEVQRLIEASVTTALKRSRVTCMTCMFFNQRAELCEKARPRARPPARVVAYGCSAHEVDDIPF